MVRSVHYRSLALPSLCISGKSQGRSVCVSGTERSGSGFGAGTEGERVDAEERGEVLGTGAGFGGEERRVFHTAMEACKATGFFEAPY